eukprot:TRINITY_DN74654_c0_g1_i1.p1 TRINITY_DN74654_c0_g1~~TRINITY_DN74654_c0_g1_i1.p1  ORF type:complete len:743 (-),score=157.90 TRINITY_DN74654_c0_g1_i1:347-2575(-)
MELAAEVVQTRTMKTAGGPSGFTSGSNSTAASVCSGQGGRSDSSQSFYTTSGASVQSPTAQHAAADPFAADFRPASADIQRGVYCSQIADLHEDWMNENHRDEEDKEQVDARDTNLDSFHGSARFAEDIDCGEFAMVRHLTKCCGLDGQVELRRWNRLTAASTRQGDDLVVVKRILASRIYANCGKERNERVLCQSDRVKMHERHAEDCLNEIGVYCFLDQQQDRSPYLLRMLTAFRSEAHVWLLLEHADEGDLLRKVQHAQEERGTLLGREEQARWSWQLLQAVAFLHRRGIAHRDISGENILIRQGEVRLMDFGQAVHTHHRGDRKKGVQMRYFGAVGKKYYRGPECNAPPHEFLDVIVPQTAALNTSTVFTRTVCKNFMCEVRLPSGAEAGSRMRAENWGYAPARADVFACGVCIFVMRTGSPPWEDASLSDYHFKWVNRHGIGKLIESWGLSVPLADNLLEQMMCSNPYERYSAEECLSSPWFATFDLPAQVAEGGVEADPLGSGGDFYTREETRRGVSMAPMDALSATGCMSMSDIYGKEFGIMAMQEDPFRHSHSLEAATGVPAAVEDAGAVEDMEMPPTPLSLALLRRAGVDEPATVCSPQCPAFKPVVDEPAMVCSPASCPVGTARRATSTPSRSAPACATASPALGVVRRPSQSRTFLSRQRSGPAPASEMQWLPPDLDLSLIASLQKSPPRRGHDVGGRAEAHLGLTGLSASRDKSRRATAAGSVALWLRSK